MRLAALLLIALFFCGCAIPVRPIALIEKDAQGRTHFVQDEAQEPQAADALGWLAPIISLIGGPYGEAGLALLTLFLGHQVGHRQATAKAKRSTPKSIVLTPTGSTTVTTP